MRYLTLPAAALALLVTGCPKAPETPARDVAPAAKAEIQWVRPVAMADVDSAFARAQAGKQPVFLFWAAAWCPPCNQVKSTIFTRQDFIEKSRSFVPVYVDGDTPSGQALGKRFSVGAYPTMVLLRPDGSEITRLAGSVEPAKYMQVLDYGIAGGSSAREALASALSGKPVSAEDWRLLAFYSWETDEQQMIPKETSRDHVAEAGANLPGRAAGSCFAPHAAGHRRLGDREGRGQACRRQGRCARRAAKHPRAAGTGRANITT